MKISNFIKQNTTYLLLHVYLRQTDGNNCGIRRSLGQNDAYFKQVFTVIKGFLKNLMFSRRLSLLLVQSIQLILKSTDTLKRDISQFHIKAFMLRMIDKMIKMVYIYYTKKSVLVLLVKSFPLK